jgi:hypothetical protein
MGLSAAVFPRMLSPSAFTKPYDQTACLNAAAGAACNVCQFLEFRLKRPRQQPRLRKKAVCLFVNGRVDATCIGILSELIRLLIAAKFEMYNCHIVDCDPCPPSCFV